MIERPWITGDLACRRFVDGYGVIFEAYRGSKALENDPEIENEVEKEFGKSRSMKDAAEKAVFTHAFSFSVGRALG